jgi:hypothetical protein
LRFHDIGNVRAPLAPLLAKEARDLLLGRAPWVLLTLLCLLVGYGFEQAVSLFAEASRAAVGNPMLARNLSPLDGIVVPNFGALYLATTFLYPFVVIRAVASEKQSGARALQLQLPYSPLMAVMAKLCVLALAWLVMTLPCQIALMFWTLIGGHIDLVETANVLLGHFLYACVVTGIALYAAVLSASGASAAIATLACTLGFFVLDFASAGGEGLLKEVAEFSLTAVLRGFERGVFSLGAVFGTGLAAFALVSLAAIWWHTGTLGRRRLALTFAVIITATSASYGLSRLNTYIDMTEDRRNSFSPADEAVLRALDRRLSVIVQLAASDPRYADFERGVLGKLRRTVPDIVVERIGAQGSGAFEQSEQDYGIIIYRYEGREASSRSTGAGEILPLIYTLVGRGPQSMPSPPPYPGYPLVAEPRGIAALFYFILPALIGLAYVITHHRTRFGFGEKTT